MSRPLMFQQEPWQAFELTIRCMQSRHLMRPGEECNRRVQGVFGRALELYGEHVHLYFAGSENNHMHLIIAAESAEWKARFKSHIKTNISKELGDLHDWRGSHWDRRCRDIPILDDDALRERLMYLAAHAVKSGLAETPFHWPGVQWVRAVTEGKTLSGPWYDRTQLDAMLRRWDRLPADTRGPRPGLGDVTTMKPIPLTPPPMWAYLEPAELRAHWSELVDEALRRYPASERPLGAAAICAIDPHTRPERTKRSPAPPVHTTRIALRKAWREAYAAFVDTYRGAMKRLRQGFSAVDFPTEGCPPPWFSPVPTG